MNKKVVLSVLSTAVVASMAASAFAAPKDGLYIGGNVNKYYSTDVLLNMNAAAKAAYTNDVKSITDFNNLVFVDFSGKGASIQEILDKGLAAAKAEPLAKEDFSASYAVATATGSTDGTYDARANVDGTTPGDLKVESVSAINAKTIEVLFNTEVDATKVITSNFTVLDKNSAPATVVNKAVLSADKKKVTLTLNDSLSAANQPYTLFINKNDIAVENNQIAIALSTTAPTVGTVTVDSKTQVTVDFDKDIVGADAVVLENVVKVVDLTDATKTYTVISVGEVAGNLVVKTTEELVPGHNYKVTVAKDSVVDAFGTKNADVEKNFSVVTNEVKPAVTKVEYVKSKVAGEVDAVVTFNIPVLNAAGDVNVKLQDRDGFVTSDQFAAPVLDSKATEAAQTARVDGLKLADNQILIQKVNAANVAMTAGKSYGLVLAKDEVKDTTLAALQNDESVASATYSVDIVAPTVTAVELVSATEIKLTLSEKASYDSTKKVVVTGYDKDGVLGGIEASVTLSADGTTAVLKPKTEGQVFTTDASEDSGYEIAADAFVDTASNKSDAIEASFKNVTDKAVPALVSATFETDKITLTFTEAVDVADAVKAKAIVVDGKNKAYATVAGANTWTVVNGKVVITAGDTTSQVSLAAGTLKDFATTANLNAKATVTVKDVTPQEN